MHYLSEYIRQVRYSTSADVKEFNANPEYPTSAMTNGNLALVCVGFNKNPDAITSGSDLTDAAVLTSQPDRDAAVYTGYRTIDGTEGSTTNNISVVDSESWEAYVLELQNCTALDVTATNHSSQSVVTSISTGTPGTPSQANLFAVAVFVADSHSNIGDRSFSNDFVELPRYVGQTAPSLIDPGIYIAVRPLSSATAIDCTMTCDGAGDQQVAAMLYFQANAVPDARRHISQSEGGTAKLTVQNPTGRATAIEYATNSSFTGSTTTATQTPTAASHWNMEFELTGLTAGAAPTTYYWRIKEGANASGVTAQFKTYGVGTALTSKYSLAFSSCHDSRTRGTALGFAAARNPDTTWNMGDQFYDDIATNDRDLFDQAHDRFWAYSGAQELTDKSQFYNVWDDHDWGGNNSGASSPSAAAAEASVRDNHGSLGLALSSGGIYRAYTHGRVRFVMLDTRYYRASGTLLGTTQKNWLKDEMTDFSNDGSLALLVICVGVPWIASSTADTWSDASAERTEIANHATTLGIDSQMMTVAGDMHGLAYDDGTNTEGGWPHYQSSPWEQDGSTKGGPYSGGTWTTTTRNAGRYTIAEFDDGITTADTMTVTVKGYDHGDSLAYTHTWSFSAPQATTGTVSATTGAASSNITGRQVFSGQIAATTGAASASLSGSLAYRGTLSATTGAASAAITGALRVEGQIGATTGAASAGIQAEQYLAGTIGATTGAATASISGESFYSASIAATTGSATASITGSLKYSGTVSATTGAATASLSGNVEREEVPGTIAATTGAATASITGQLQYAGTLSATTGAASASITAEIEYRAAIGATTGAASSALQGSPVLRGTIGATTGAASSSIAAQQALSGAVAATTGAASASLSGNVLASADREGTITATTGSVTAAITGKVGRGQVASGRSRKWREEWKRRYEEQQQEATSPQPAAPTKPAARIKDRLPRNARKVTKPAAATKPAADVNAEQQRARIRRRRRDEAAAVVILSRFL